MATKKKDKTYIDAHGNTICQHPDGSSEMYVGGKENHKRWLDVSDEADEGAKRKRFLPDYSRPENGGTATREPQPGLDFDDPEFATSGDVEDSISDDDK